jgi:tetratricopeptide (TPR) repeat protein
VGVDYHNLGETGRAIQYYTKAFELRDRASEREKLGITADYYQNVTGELEKAADIYQQQIALYPRWATAYGNLATVYAELGQFDKAIAATNQGKALEPDRVTWDENLADYGLALNRYDETRKIATAALAKNPEDPIFHVSLYGVAFLTNDEATMAAQEKWLLGQPDYEHFGLSLAADTAAYGGQVKKARELTQRAVLSAVHADNKESAGVWQAIGAQREAVFGNDADAKAQATEALKLVPDSSSVRIEAAFALALAGDSARAETIAQALERDYPLNTPIQSWWLPAIRGQVALNKKDPQAALNLLKAAEPIELGAVPFLANGSCLYPTYVRGQAYLAEGQGKDAAAEFQKVLDHGGLVWNCWTGAMARVGVARANFFEFQNLQGAEADAARVRGLRAYQEFMALWKDADADVPLLKQVRAEMEKLR